MKRERALFFFFSKINVLCFQCVFVLHLLPPKISSQKKITRKFSNYDQINFFIFTF